MNVLLVEPDVLLAELYERSLQPAGHEVASVRGAQQAVMAADETPPDIVILEPLLALHNGVEFLYEFRSYTEWSGIPIVLLTRNAAAFESRYRMMQAELGICQIVAKHALLSGAVTLPQLVARHGGRRHAAACSKRIAA